MLEAYRNFWLRRLEYVSEGERNNRTPLLFVSSIISSLGVGLLIITHLRLPEPLIEKEYSILTYLLVFLSPIPEGVGYITLKITETNHAIATRGLQLFDLQMLPTDIKHRRERELPILFSIIGIAFTFFYHLPTISDRGSDVRDDLIHLALFFIFLPLSLATAAIWSFTTGRLASDIAVRIENFCSIRRLEQEARQVIMLRDMRYKGTVFPDLSYDMYATILGYVNGLDQVSAAHLIRKVEAKDKQSVCSDLRFFSKLPCLKAKAPETYEGDEDIETGFSHYKCS